VAKFIFGSATFFAGPEIFFGKYKHGDFEAFAAAEG
jgi:2-hydroxychromene-2-carboxylate isomerase